MGENVDIGAGTMTVNRALDWKPIAVKNGKKTIDTGMIKLGAFIGDNVVIGAGNTIEPGTVIPQGKVMPSCYTISRE